MLQIELYWDVCLPLHPYHQYQQIPAKWREWRRTEKKKCQQNDFLLCKAKM
jgi:hypothetical protein